MNTKPFSPSTERNREPILAVLREWLTDRTEVLEIGSGTGQHAVCFGAALPHLRWQTSEVAANLPGIRMWLAEAALANTPAPLIFDLDLDFDFEPPTGRFDAVFTANVLHIVSWQQVERLFASLPGLMRPGGLLMVYGPFKQNGEFSGPGDASFDEWLRAEAPHRGLRDLEAVDELARRAGLTQVENRAMPANNRLIAWRMSPRMSPNV